MGFTDAMATPTGPDGGVDVVSTGALAQVKWQGAQVGRPEVQRLFGARGQIYHKKLFFFAASGYSQAAIVYADAQDIHLYTYDRIGNASAISRAAKALVFNPGAASAQEVAPGVIVNSNGLHNMEDPNFQSALRRSFSEKMFPMVSYINW
ncbi:restriction endonuclease [Nocardia asteroides]|uniref:restriction endonuclease n=1 Tax=Nocardia asteroides TaxID=1824 RepID=UPI0037B8E066